MQTFVHESYKFINVMITYLRGEKKAILERHKELCGQYNNLIWDVKLLERTTSRVRTTDCKLTGFLSHTNSKTVNVYLDDVKRI